jgi:protein involved in polysaccharide export with SLBB domain
LTACALFLGGCDSTRSKDPNELGGGPQDFATVPQTKEAESNQLRPGDTVELFVLDNDEFSGRYLVRSDGSIILRRVGRVMVGSLSPKAAEAAVKRALDAGQLTDARVILERSPKAPKEEIGVDGAVVKVFVSGKVLRPGPYQLTSVGGRPPTAYQAVLQAGDCIRFAQKSKVHVLRQTGDGKYSKIAADLAAIESGEIEDVILLNGDTVVVPEKTIGFGS